MLPLSLYLEGTYHRGGCSDIPQVIQHSEPHRVRQQRHGGGDRGEQVGRRGAAHGEGPQPGRAKPARDLEQHDMAESNVM